MSSLVKARAKTAMVGLNWSNSSFDVIGAALVPLLERANLDYDVFRAGVGLEIESLLKRTVRDDEVAYLSGCLPEVVQSIAFQAATLGLVPGASQTGRMCSAIVRYSKDSKRGWAISGHTVLVQPEWRGVIFLMRKANPEIEDIKIVPVCEGDEVKVDVLNDRVVSHTTGNSESRDASIELTETGFKLINNRGGYVIVTFTGGRQRVLMVSKADIVRSISSSDTMRLPYQNKPDKRASSPWFVHTNPMIYKSLAHALYRKPDVWAGRAANNEYLEALRRGAEAINKADRNRVTSIEDRSSPLVGELLSIVEDIGADSDFVDRVAASIGCDSADDAFRLGRGEELIDAVVASVE